MSTSHASFCDCLRLSRWPAVYRAGLKPNSGRISVISQSLHPAGTPALQGVTERSEKKEGQPEESTQGVTRNRHFQGGRSWALPLIRRRPASEAPARAGGRTSFPFPGLISRQPAVALLVNSPASQALFQKLDTVRRACAGRNMNRPPSVPAP